MIAREIEVSVDLDGERVVVSAPGFRLEVERDVAMNLGDQIIMCADRLPRTAVTA